MIKYLYVILVIFVVGIAVFIASDTSESKTPYMDGILKPVRLSFR